MQFDNNIIKKLYMVYRQFILLAKESKDIKNFKYFTENDYLDEIISTNTDLLYKLFMDKFNAPDLASEQVLEINQWVNGKGPRRIYKEKVPRVRDHVVGRLKSTREFINVFRERTPSFYEFVLMILYHTTVIPLEKGEHNDMLKKCIDIESSMDLYKKYRVKIMTIHTHKRVSRKNFEKYFAVSKARNKYILNKNFVSLNKNLQSLLDEVKQFSDKLS
jgi:hypothetical protein